MDCRGRADGNGTLTTFYSTLLDQMAYIATRTRGFVVPMSRAPVNAPYLTQTRRVQEATMLLAFRPGHVIDWADLEQGSNRLSVWPEEGIIYPTRPRQSMRQPHGRGCLAATGVACARGIAASRSPRVPIVGSSAPATATASPLARAR